MPKRDYKTFWRRFGNEAASASPLAGLGIAVVGGGAAVVTTAAVAAVAGGVVAVGALAWCGYRAIPPRRTTPEELIWKEVELSDLNKLSRPIIRVGVVGETASGKSTLISHLFKDGKKPPKTPRISAWILRTRDRTEEVYALIDGAGEDYAQQFAIALVSDMLIFVVDHNASDTGARIVGERVEAHRRFATQLKNQLASSDRKPLRVLVLVNKHDQWVNSTTTDRMDDLKTAIKSILSETLSGDSIAVREHSNFKHADNTLCCEDISAAIRSNKLRGL